MSVLTESTTTFWRGDPGYERARRNAVANGRKPNRFPDVIVRAQTDKDVVEAVRLANTRDLKIGIRSGGHSWAASFLCDGGMLLDLSQMTDFSIDTTERTATVRPAVRGADLDLALRNYGLFFPIGHCLPVTLGGFLLQGGFGWDSRFYGPACCSVSAIDVITADGELVHADQNQNADLFWAARGAGPGFFGVVTRFHLGLKPRPQVMMKSDYLYPIEELDQVLRWSRAMQPSLPRNMEPLVFVRRDMFGHPGPTALVTGLVMADSESETRAALALLETCPVLRKAVMREVNIVTELDDLLQGGDQLLYPPGAHCATDNMWTSASVNALLPGVHEIVETMPPAPAHMLWMLWGPTEPRPDMAFSLESDLYLALYGISMDEAGESQCQAWVTERMRELEPLADGIQLADENLGARSFRFLSERNLQRLETIRRKRDPNGRFHSYMATPAR
jgi:FAD/FMN-containing dehydrogenase